MVKVNQNLADGMSPRQYRAIRQELGLSQRALAEKLGIRRETVIRREFGRYEIGIEAIRAMSDLWSEMKKGGK